MSTKLFFTFLEFFFFKPNLTDASLLVFGDQTFIDVAFNEINLLEMFIHTFGLEFYGTKPLYSINYFDYIESLNFLDNNVYIMYIISFLIKFNFIFYIKKIMFLISNFILYYFIFLFILRLLFSKYFFSISLQNLQQFYFEFEHNVGNGEDLLMFISLILSIIILNFLYFYITCYDLNLYMLKTYLIIIFIFIPIRILLSFGSNFINFLRGTSTCNKFSIDLFSSTITLIVFFIRFFLQSLRLALLSVFYFSINEYIFSIPNFYITNFIVKAEVYSDVNLFIIGLKFLRLFFELLDSTLSICNQLASFFFVIF